MRSVVVDLETSDFKSDMGTLLVACFGLLGEDGEVKELRTKTITSISRDKEDEVRERKLAEWARNQWGEADVVIGQNHLAFDRHFLNGVLFRNNCDLLPKRILIDTYQTAKGRFAMSTSMANMLDIWHLGRKDAPDKDDWRKANHGDSKALNRIAKRCEEDVVATARLWAKLKPVYMDTKGR